MPALYNIQKCLRIIFHLNNYLHLYIGEMAAADTLELIKTLPPELLEKIFKHYLAIKVRERNEMGWNKVHEHILKLPFCYKRQRIVRMIICFDYKDCRFEGCCYPCLVRARKLHKVLISPPIESIPDFPTKEYNPFLEICSNDCDWHEWYH